MQSHASASVRTLKFQTLAAIPFFGHTKIPHTLTGMGSAALAAAVPYPSKVSQFPARDKDVLKETDRQRQRDRYRETKRERERDRDRDRERHRETERDREKNTISGWRAASPRRPIHWKQSGTTY